MHCYRGVVCYYDFGRQVGSVQGSYRPCLIVGNNKQNTSSNICVVVPITSADKKSLPTHIIIPKGQYNVSGTILCEQLFTVSQDLLEVTNVHIGEELMSKVDHALSIELDLKESSKLRELSILRGQLEVLKEEVERYRDFFNNVKGKNISKVKK